MPYDISWYIPRRIMIVRLLGEFSTEDAIRACGEIKNYLDAGTPPLYIISDETCVES